MGFQISTTRSFVAGHQLRGYDGCVEELHSHNWQVRVVVSASVLDRMGLVMDFQELENVMKAVIDPLQNVNLNELPRFSGVNPSAENLAGYIADSLLLPKNVQLVSVEVWETAGNSAIYAP